MKNPQYVKEVDSRDKEIPGPRGGEIIRWAKAIGEELVQTAAKPIINSNKISKSGKSNTHITPCASNAVSKPQRESATTSANRPSFGEMFKHKKPVLYSELKVRSTKALEPEETETIPEPPAVPQEELPPVREAVAVEPLQEISQLDIEEVTDDAIIKMERDFWQKDVIEGVAISGVVPTVTVTNTEADEQVGDSTIESQVENIGEIVLTSVDVGVEDISVNIHRNTCEDVPEDTYGDTCAAAEQNVDKGIDEVNVHYTMPEISMLTKPHRNHSDDNSDEVIQKGLLLEQTLLNFGVKVQVVDFVQGPAITRFELQPAPGVKVSRIVALADDIALSLAAPDVRIEAPVPGKAVVGIEVPNDQVAPVYFREVIESEQFQQGRSPLAFALGKDIAGESVVADLARMPHLLIAGSTGSGKSVCMNALITSILFRSRPDQVKFLMIDPKMVELSTYNGIPHLISPVIIDPKKATAALKWVVSEMENRYNLFAGTAVRNIAGYNQKMTAEGKQQLPLIVVVIDELADLMMVASRDVEDAICRLAQMARAAGIHLVIATQRPSVDVITGIIKANIPSRIAFAVSSQVDSRTILDMAGAEKLLGRGDMLFYPTGVPKPQRVQGVFVSDTEIEQLVNHLKAQGKPEYLDPIASFEATKATASASEDDDELLPEAARLVIVSGQASVSFLQRRLRVGYARAARLIDLLEEKGVVGGYEGSKPREVLISAEQWENLDGDLANLS